MIDLLALRSFANNSAAKRALITGSNASLRLSNAFRVIFQVHLHAADIDIFQPVGLKSAHCGDSGGLSGVKTALSVGQNGPGPGKM